MEVTQIIAQLQVENAPMAFITDNIHILERWAKYFNQEAVSVLAGYLYQMESQHDLNAHTFEATIIQALMLEASLPLDAIPGPFRVPDVLDFYNPEL